MVSPIPLDPAANIGIYIHVPFCRARCRYCDFFSTTDLERADLFVDALLREMDLACPMWRGTVDTVYLGGGTPSALSADHVATILGAVFDRFELLPGAEITVEANPDSATADWLKAVKKAGANRVSIGVQSFDDGNLSFLGRLHSAGHAFESVAAAKVTGFDSISIDMICGIPGQDLYGLQRDMETALSLEPDHLSCYMLTFEDGTPIARDLAAGHFSAPTDDLCALFFETVSGVLTGAGYRHYEISNFAKGEGGACRHNMKYWRRAPYLGLGPSAHSYDGARTRSWNLSDLDRYVESVRSGSLPLESREELSARQLMTEAIYLGFRTADGVSAQGFCDEFGIDFETIFSPAIRQCLEEGLLEKNDRAYVPTLRGMLFHETVALRFASLLP